MLRFIARGLPQMVPVLFVIGTHEALLMVDATTDSKALSQAREFQGAFWVPAKSSAISLHSTLANSSRRWSN